METQSSQWNPTVFLRNCRVTRREVLFTIAVLLTEIGCNYCMDIPASLEVNMTKYLDLTSNQYSLFYSLYFLPTILCNTAGGILIDRWLGIRWTVILFSLVAVIGIAIFAVGGLLKVYWAMLLGRLIFGLGNEIGTGVCVSYCLFSWYQHIMNFTSTMNANVSYLGTMAIFQSSPRIFNWLENTTSYSKTQDIGLTILITSFVMIPTAFCALWMTLLGPQEENTNQNGNESIKLKDIFKFPITYWLVCLQFGFNTAMGTFTQYSQGLFTVDLHMTQEEASNAMTVYTLTQCFVAVVVSILVDRIGRNVIVVQISAVLAVIPHLLLYFDQAPYLAMFVLGLSQSFYGSSIQPMFGYTVNDESMIGSCYGIMSSSNGLFMFATPFLMGYLIDAYSFRTAQLFYVLVAAANIFLVLFIWMLDKKKTDGVLSMSSKQRILLMERRKNKPDDSPTASLSITTSNDSTTQLIATP